MVLVDTSVWIDHFRSGTSRLSGLLEEGEVVMHAMVVGELACGNLSNRNEILSLLHALPSISRVHDEEVLFFIEEMELMGRGLGLVDLHLLASCRLRDCMLWTRDKRLAAVAKDLGLDFQ